ncbi:response regulator [Paenibacillus sp. J22TS3]|uniref:response regulator n=1 Tax=Paenibacillus sp. J22TS3 TaxID=2807192 RepID=UPI001B1DFA17|nr:response regulator [Paenibacillus sp. J22TS3]GIP21170.1 hypothetical protein J22TS3_14450 [Paenibacillus sp. J22TS3]
MYKIVIVDDEAIVSRGLSEKVNWQEMNCTVCATASNGFEGKEVIEKMRPDIVITDIKMPGMNGLELAEYIRGQYPDIVTILLSGYSDFNFARTAMRQQVFDYLLKPIEIADLKACILKAIDKMQSHTPVIGDAERENLDILESGMIMNLIVNGNRELENTAKKMKECGIKVTNGQIVVFELYEASDPSYAEYASIYQFAVNNIVTETYRLFDMNTTIVNFEGKSVVVVKTDAGIQQIIMQRRVLEATTLCLENVSTYLKKLVSVGIGSSFRGIEQICDSFQQALKMLDIQLFWGIHKPEPFFGSAIAQVNTPMDSRLTESILEGDYNEAKFYWNVFASNIKAGRNKSAALNSCLDFLIGLSKHVPQGDAKNQITQAITEITGLRTFEEYCSVITEIIIRVCDEVNRRKKVERARSLSDRIILYLDTHYFDASLNLQYIADTFHVSTSHVSRLFKKEKGINFNEYLTVLRVEKAKELLNSSQRLTVQEIANNVGFMDGKYFGQVFKKYYGITPSEYKESKASIKCS